MGVTGLKKCFFFVWTFHGFFVEEIKFDVHRLHSLKCIDNVTENGIDRRVYQILYHLCHFSCCRFLGRSDKPSSNSNYRPEKSYKIRNFANYKFFHLVSKSTMLGHRRNIKTNMGNKPIFVSILRYFNHRYLSVFQNCSSIDRFNC